MLLVLFDFPAVGHEGVGVAVHHVIENRHLDLNCVGENVLDGFDTAKLLDQRVELSNGKFRNHERIRCHIVSLGYIALRNFPLIRGGTGLPTLVCHSIENPYIKALYAMANCKLYQGSN